jgi:hypothetical protein
MEGIPVVHGREEVNSWVNCAPRRAGGVGVGGRGRGDNPAAIASESPSGSVPLPDSTQMKGRTEQITDNYCVS